MKFNITCKVGVYSNPIKITFNNKSKTLTYKNSKVTFNFDADTEYELTIEQIHKYKESVPTRLTNIVLKYYFTDSFLSNRLIFLQKFKGGAKNEVLYFIFSQPNWSFLFS